MINKLRYIYGKEINDFLILLLIVIFCSCSKTLENNPIPEQTTTSPKNLTWSIQIVGSNSQNPNGNGSGLIRCEVNAENAVRYVFNFNDEEVLESANGIGEYIFTKTGLNDYLIGITAFSSSNEQIGITKSITVHVDGEEEVATDDFLMWSDEFNATGPVDTSNWFSEIIPPVNGGWYNAEQQHYTDRLENAFVSDGTLKIRAKKESYTFANSTKNYTSARLNSKFSFTYGRIEVKAKLPEGKGTWPAIWTLGSNLNSIGWPFCGEIDIMEHVGNKIGDISSAIHTPSSNGNTVNIGRIDIPDATTEFHVYAVDWTADKMDFYVDDILFYTYDPTIKDNNTWPFNSDQFILLNIAMGGTLGGNIDPDFEQAVMEIDYVRVYRN
ncbi:glycoside hydrolase family 16 protein [Maribacter sp. CXY002]|uniref:glycoside hydrolase family 16 protein n=1 Tax=Maribacter luteocoastalis TaxID=3407671 RepID=UPI003B67F189